MNIVGQRENLHCLYRYKRAGHSKKNKTRAFALGISSSGQPSLRVNFNDKASTPTTMCRNSINLDISLSSGRSRIFLRGAPTPKMGMLTYCFANLFAKNCMKIKEFGPGGVPGIPLGSANVKLDYDLELSRRSKFSFRKILSAR